MTVNERTQRLRALMKTKGVDAVWIGTADPHNSEYIAPYYQARAWLTGFTGSAGTALVTADRALLWADGRYYIQAEKELVGSAFELMKQGQPEVPTPWEWLETELPQGSRVAADGRLLPEAEAQRQTERLLARGVELVTDLDLIDSVWEDRPALPTGSVFEHRIEFTGRSASDKIALIRAKMAEDGADYALYVGLDDVAWLMNFRGTDVPHNCVAMAYALISRDRALLVIDPAKVGQALLENFTAQGIEIQAYDRIYDLLGALPPGVLVTDTNRTSRALIDALPESVDVLCQQDYPYLIKAELNEVELASQFRAGIRDSLAVTKLIYYAKTQPAKESLTELDIIKRLHLLRQEGSGYIIDSFPTISAYGANAAMMHYAASPEHNAALEARGFLLVDCGGQYQDGTTDITRTISLGPLTDEEIRDYTLTLKSHIALASLPFLKGTSGVALDAVARSVMWRQGLDYKCGTGHGLGFLAGVHEGPQRLTNNVRAGQYGFRPHNVITIEPGIYREGRHGIRLENDYVVLRQEQSVRIQEGRALIQEEALELNEAGDRFLRFQSLTFVPFDREAIDRTLLTQEERAWLNDYHQAVRDALAPSLSDELLDFLLQATEPF